MAENRQIKLPKAKSASQGQNPNTKQTAAQAATRGWAVSGSAQLTQTILSGAAQAVPQGQAVPAARQTPGAPCELPPVRQTGQAGVGQPAQASAFAQQRFQQAPAGAFAAPSTAARQSAGGVGAGTSAPQRPAVVQAGNQAARRQPAIARQNGAAVQRAGQSTQPGGARTASPTSAAALALGRQPRAGAAFNAADAARLPQAAPAEGQRGSTASNGRVSTAALPTQNTKSSAGVGRTAGAPAAQRQRIAPRSAAAVSTEHPTAVSSAVGAVRPTAPSSNEKKEKRAEPKDALALLKNGFGAFWHWLCYTRRGTRRSFMVLLAGGTALVFFVCAIITFCTFYFSNSMLFRAMKDVELPNFQGKTEEQIKADGSYRFDFEYIEVYTDEAPKGEVFDQTPKPPCNVKENAHITLRVSAGVEEVKVPDIVGLTREEAKEAMKKSSLNIMLKPVVDETVVKDNVVSTQPAAGKTVKAGDMVYVFVSRGEDTSVEVPQVIGCTSLIEANRLLVEAHLTYELSPDGGSDGEILSQTPLAGEKVPRGSKVILTLAGGGGTTVIPEYQEYGVDGHKHDYQPSTVVAPNAVSLGYTVFVCKECGYYYYGDFTQPTG